MKLGRREFLAGSASTVAALLAMPALMISGCAINVKALLETLIASVQALLKVAGTSSWVTTVQNALTQLSTAVAAWTAGSTVTLVEQALNALEAVLAVIPLTAVYSPLVDVIVAGIDAVLNVLVPAPTTQRMANNANPHHGRIILHRGTFETWQGAYKKAFNTEAKLIGMPEAEI